MRSILVVAFLALAAVLVALCELAGEQPDRKKVEQAILQLEKQRREALLKSDVATLERIWADGCTAIPSNGRLSSKAETLKAVKEGKLKYDSLVEDELVVRVYGDTALVTGRQTLVPSRSTGWKTAGQTVRRRMTHLWVQRDGKWQMVHHQVTLIAEPPAGGDAKEAAAKKELEELAGTWRTISREIDGKKLPREEAEQHILVQDEHGRLELRREGQVVVEATCRIDPTKSPKEIDFTATKGDHKGQTLWGIYKLEGDTRTVCFAPPGKERPTQFASKPGSGYVLTVSKRERHR